MSESNGQSIKARLNEYELFDNIPYSGSNEKLPNPDISVNGGELHYNVFNLC